MFLGEYQHSLDAKGRIILPSKFRALLADGCVLTRGIDKCLAVYPTQEWESVSSRLKDASQSNRGARDFLRIWYASAVEEEPGLRLRTKWSLKVIRIGFLRRCQVQEVRTSIIGEYQET